MNIQTLAVTVGLASAIASTSCSTSTTLTDVWRDPSYSAGPMHKLLVFGGTPNESARRSVEDSFASALGHHGVRATPSYTVFQDRQTSRDVVRDYLGKEGYDGALVLRFKGIKTQTTVEPHADFVGYYGTFWGPGYYVETDQYVKVETTLWDARTAKLVWSAASETENPSSSSDAITSVTTKIISSLMNEGFIPPLPAVAYVTR